MPGKSYVPRHARIVHPMPTLDEFDAIVAGDALPVYPAWADCPYAPGRCRCVGSLSPCRANHAAHGEISQGARHAAAILDTR